LSLKLAADSLSPRDQSLLDFELKLLKNKIIDFIEGQMMDFVIKKIKQGETEDSIQWMTSYEEFADKEKVREYEKKISSAKLFVKISAIISGCINQINKAFSSTSKGAVLLGEFSSLIDDLRSKETEIEFRWGELNDESRTDLKSLKETYEKEYSRAKNKHTKLMFEFSQANTIIESHEYQMLLENIESLEEDLTENHKILLPFKMDFEENTCSFINQEQRELDLNEAKIIVREKWKIWSECKYSKYIEAFDSRLPQEGMPIREDPKTIRNDWETSLSKGLMLLKDISDTDLDNRVANLEKKFKKVEGRYENYHNEIIRRAEIGDVFTRYSQLMDYKNDISQNAPCLLQKINEKLAESKNRLEEYLRVKLPEFRLRFVKNPDNIHFDIEKILGAIQDKTSFAIYVKDLEAIREQSYLFKEQISRLDRISDASMIVKAIDEYGIVLSKINLQLPELISNKRNEALIWSSPQKTAEDLVSKGELFRKKINEKLNEISQNEVDQELENIERVYSLVGTTENPKLLPIQLIKQKLESFKGLLIELQAYFSIKTLIDKPGIDLSIIEQNFKDISNEILLTAIKRERNSFLSMKANENSVQLGIRNVREKIQEKSDLSSLIKQFLEVDKLRKRPSTLKNDLEKLYQELLGLIDPSVQEFLKDLTEDNLVANIETLKQVLAYSELIVQDDPNLGKDVQQLLNKAQAKKSEDQCDWLTAYKNWQSIDINDQYKGQKLACLKLHVLSKAVNNDFQALRTFIFKGSQLMDDEDIRTLQSYVDFNEIKTRLKNSDLSEIQTDDLRKYHERINNTSYNQEGNDTVEIPNWIIVKNEYEDKYSDVIQDFRNKYPQNDLTPKIEVNLKIFNKILDISNLMTINGKLSDFYKGKLAIDNCIANPLYQTPENLMAELLRRFKDNLRSSIYRRR
jgi:hypothetical protein